MFLPFKRATLLIPSGPEHDLERKHLFVLLTDSIKNKQTKILEVLIVPISSIKHRCDETCILRPGDHSFIKHESFVFYQKCRIENTNNLILGVDRGLFSPKDPIDTEIFSRICDGIGQSRFAPQKYKKFYYSS